MKDVEPLKIGRPFRRTLLEPSRFIRRWSRPSTRLPKPNSRVSSCLKTLRKDMMIESTTDAACDNRTEPGIRYFFPSSLISVTPPLMMNFHIRTGSIQRPDVLSRGRMISSPANE